MSDEPRNTNPIFILGQCKYCEHYVDQPPFRYCVAFPGGIPDPILINDFDHRKPFPNQEGSTVLTLKPDLPDQMRLYLLHALDQIEVRHRKRIEPGVQTMADVLGTKEIQLAGRKSQVVSRESP